MKKIIFCTFSLLLIVSAVFFPDDAFAETALKPQLIKGHYQYPDNTFVEVVYRNGKYVPYEDAGDYQVGDIANSYVTQIFDLTFWNVGSQSANKDHAKAVLEITTRSTKAGLLIKSPSVWEEHPKLGPRWKIYGNPEASRQPDQVDKFEFTFSGGIDGIFTPVGNTEILDKKLKGGKIVKSDDNSLSVSIEYESGGAIAMNITKYLANFLEETIDSTMKFEGINGSVEILLPGKGSRGWESALKYYRDKNFSLPVGTRIRTKDASSVMLSLPNAQNPMTIINQNSEVVITYEPAKTKTAFELLKMVNGQAMHTMKRIFTEGSMEIEMNQAVAGIKGTTLVLEDDGQTSSVKVIDGIVSFKSKITDEIKDVTAGQMLAANQDGLGEVETFDIKAETAKWNSIKAQLQEGSGETEEPISSESWTDRYWYLLLILVFPLGIIIWRLLKTKNSQ